MKTLKIEVTEQTSLEGVIYYYLFFNGKYETLSRNKDEIMEKVRIATDVFNSGKTEPLTVYSVELETTN